MAVAFDNAISGINTTLNTTATVTLSVGALTNACAVVIVGWAVSTGAARTVSTVKLDATTAFTRLNGTTLTNKDATDDGLDIWYLIGASLTNASHTFDVTMSGNANVKYILAMTFSGADQTTPLAGFASDNTDIVSPSSVSPAGGVANDMMVGGFMNVNGGAATVGISAPATQRSTTQSETAFEGTQFLGGTNAGNAASIGFTWTATIADMTVGALVKAAGGATRPVKMAGEWGGYAGVGGGFAG